MEKQKRERLESDLLGELMVPADALFGIQTQRALENFPLSDEKSIGEYPLLVKALMYIKKAAAKVNKQLGSLPDKKADSIVKAVDKVIEQKLFDQFPIHFLHGGGGTSANMNANEVLANIAEEELKGKRGQYSLVHPNDHVNLNQSTNDVYPTACHIAVILKWPKLREKLQLLINIIDGKAMELQDIRKIARTCLQDAVDISFKDFFSGYSSFIQRAVLRINKSVDELHCINLGGTIVGRDEDAPEAYRRMIVDELGKTIGDDKYRPAENFFDAAQNSDHMAEVSGQLAILARGLIKIAKDFRLMCSGPETGLKEIKLPAVQPGSSIMPGKVNPVIPEFVIQCCFQVLGHDLSCQCALEHGELDLNVWESTMVFNLLDSMSLLSNAADVFGNKCIKDLEVDTQINKANCKTIIPALTRLMHAKGYSAVNEILKKTGDNSPSIQDFIKRENI